MTKKEREKYRRRKREEEEIKEEKEEAGKLKQITKQYDYAPSFVLFIVCLATASVITFKYFIFYLYHCCRVECVSIGPLIENAHSPDERLVIATVPQFYSVLKTTLQELANSKK